MSPVTPSSASAAPSGQTSSTSAGSTTPTMDKEMFLRLLVAQLQNQDPLNPTDGTAFVTQLAQFQQLEQSVNTGQDVTAIRQDLDQLASAASKGSSVSQS